MSLVRQIFFFFKSKVISSPQRFNLPRVQSKFVSLFSFIFREWLIFITWICFSCFMFIVFFFFSRSKSILPRRFGFYLSFWKIHFVIVLKINTELVSYRIAELYVIAISCRILPQYKNNFGKICLTFFIIDAFIIFS